MRRSVIWSLSVFALILWTCPLAAQFQKQGVASGTVHDILRMRATSGTEDFWWLASAGGIFSGRYPTMEEIWTDQGAGVYTPLILKVDGYARGMGQPQMKAILTDDGVYALLGMGAFLPADTQGLADGYMGASDVAVAANLDGTNTVYLAFNGGGVWRRGFCGDAWCAREKLFGQDTVEVVPSTLWDATGLWHQDRCSKHSGLWSWKAGLDDYDLCDGSYPDNTTSTLTMTAPVDLGAAGHGYFLRFWDRTDTDYGADRCIVQICDELGGNCVDLDSRYGQSSWENRNYDLGAFEGLRRVRFVFQSDNLPSGWTTLGWFIDDIEISRTSGGGAWEPVLDASLNSIPNPYVSALYVHDANGSHTVFAATLESDPLVGDVYAVGTGTWAGMATPHYSYLSIDGPDAGSNRLILAGTAGHGVMSASPGGDFTPFCPTAPPPGNFIDVSVDHGEQPEPTYAAVTANAAYRLDPLCPASPYLQYTQFDLPAISILADCSNSGVAPNRILVGTAGLGLMALNCTNRTAPPTPVAAEGLSTSPLTMKSLSRIAVSTQGAPTVFAASPSDGLYKSRFPVDGRDYFVRHFYDPATQGTHAGTAVALAPLYDETAPVGSGRLRVYLGTTAHGIFRSMDGGSSWTNITPVQWTDPLPAVADLVEVPGSVNPALFALTAGASVWRSDDWGNTWVQEVNLNQSTIEYLAFDLAVSPNFAQDGAAFVATNAGLFKRFDGVWEPAPVLEGVPVLSVATAPLFNDDVRPSEDNEVRGVLAGTQGYGVWVSLAWGDMASFAPISPMDPLQHHLTWADVPVLAMHPDTDLDALRTDTLYHCFVSQHPSSIMPEDGAYCMSCVDPGDGTCDWTASSASGWTNPLPDARITDLAFHPAFRRHPDAPANPHLYAAHQNKKLFKGTFDTLYGSNTYDFQPSAGFHHTPPFVYAVAESPDLPGTVLAGTKGYGPMMSFDGGLSFYPWPAVQKDGYVLHDVFSSAFTHWTGSSSRLLLSAGDPSLTPAEYGIFYQDYHSPLAPEGWSRASLCLSGCTSAAAYSPANFDGDQVLELRYLNLTTDLLASDFTEGPLKSDPADPYVPGALGQYWQVEMEGAVPSSISDLSFGSGGARATWDPRGKTTFIWGAQGTLSMGFSRSSTPGAFRFNPNLTVAAWETASGASLCALPAATNWRAVQALNASTVLIGARDGMGIYRTGTADAAVSADICWAEANLGLNADDRDGDSTQYSKRVTAFTQAANGTLASLEATPAAFARAGTGDEPGGVFFSDSASAGRAWVPVAAGITCASSYELAGGSKFYTGTTCDGIYAATTITYDGTPTAYFESQASTDPWQEESVTFTDYSAGLPESRTWNFGDGSPLGTANPTTHAYDALPGYSGYVATLTSTNQVTEYTSHSDTHQVSVTVVSTLITEVTKIGDDQLRIAWDEVSGGGLSFAYHLYRAAGPEGSGLDLVGDYDSGDCAGGVCSCVIMIPEEETPVYFKIQTTW